MKNSEQPIAPTLTYNPISGETNGHLLGLTKREYFAGIALSTMDLSEYLEICGAHVFESMALDAVRLADTLLQKLEETQL